MSEVSELLEEAKGFAEFAAEGFTEPDEEWMPSAIGKDADKKVIVMAIDCSFFATPESKNELAYMMARQVVEAGLVSFSLTLAAWAAVGEDPRPPAERPDKKEILVVTSLTADEALMATADVHRFEDKPPELGEWKVEDEPHKGRFSEPVQLALQLVKESRKLL